MKQTLIKVSSSPQVKAACTTVLTELTQHGVKKLYNRFMDALAYKIAVQMHKLEQREKTGEINGI